MSQAMGIRVKALENRVKILEKLVEDMQAIMATPAEPPQRRAPRRVPKEPELIIGERHA